MKHISSTLIALAAATAPAVPLQAASAYIFSSDTRPNLIMHPSGYTGTGGTLTVSVGIDPNSPNAANMIASTKRSVKVMTERIPQIHNVLLFSQNDIGGSQVDFVSTLLHEIGHSLGLAHVNLATESGLSGDNRNYSKSTDGANDSFDINAGSDGIRGSSDDIRGDDVNLLYFNTANNDPFTLPTTVDSTTYSRDTSDLPSGTWVANADRDVGNLLGYQQSSSVRSEAVMQQGAFSDEDQRALGHTDVAGLRYAMSGLDEIQGTSDDYNLVLEYVGLTTSADIVVSFNDAQTGFAVSSSFFSPITADHWRITANNIYFNTGFSWYYVPDAPPTWDTFQQTAVEDESTVTLTSAIIAASDLEEFADDILITLDSTPTGGTLFNNNVAMAANDSFTMADVENNLITFTHSAGAPLANVTLSLGDATITDHDPRTLNIAVNGTREIVIRATDNNTSNFVEILDSARVVGSVEGDGSTRFDSLIMGIDETFTFTGSGGGNNETLNANQ